MAFAKRKLPLVVGVEAAGEIAPVGEGVTHSSRATGRRVRRADLRHLQGLPRGPRQSLRKRRRRHGLPRRRLRARTRQHAGAARHPGAGRRRAFATRPARRSRSAPCSTCCSTTPNSNPAKRFWCRPAAPASARPRSRWRRRSAHRLSRRSATTRRSQKAKALGADHVINYRTERFEGEVRKLTAQERRRRRLRACRRRDVQRLAAVPQARRTARDLRLDLRAVDQINLLQLFLQQYRIFGSFGCTIRNMHESLAKMAAGPHARDRHRSVRSPISRGPGAPRRPARCSARSS